MKTSTKILAGLGTVALLTGSAFAGASLADDRDGGFTGHWDRGHPMELAQAGGPPMGMMQRARFGGRHGHIRGRFGDRLMEQFDANKDGKLSQAEVDKARADQLAKFDADKDGKLSLKEYEALWLDAMHRQMVRAFQRHDADGDGTVTVAEFQDRFKNLVARLDSNDDGVFSKDDVRQRQKEMREHRREREQRHRHSREF